MKVVKEEIKPPSSSSREDTASTVKVILEDVRQQGDAALRRYTEKFDGVKLDNFKLDREEISRRLKDLDASAKSLIDVNAKRIAKFARFQLAMYRNRQLNVDSGGTILGYKIMPLDTVGTYVPGGRYPLLSSSLMTIIPAKVVGVRRIVSVTPPGNNRPHPATLYGMVVAGATDIFTIGGAQAIAAMAYGTSSMPKVDKIVGPGNRFVNEAKKQLFGQVGIDLLAGPSEVLVFADDSAIIEHVIYDLLAQAEHDPDARASLVTTSEELADKVAKQMDSYIEKLDTREILKLSWENHGSIIVVDSIQKGVEYVDGYAPEHLELHLNKKNMAEAFKKLRNYGSIFLGDETPVVFSDKLIGTNHTLPTGTAARYTGGLSVGAYLKILTYQNVRTKKSRKFLARHAAEQSKIENLSGHQASAELRT